MNNNNLSANNNINEDLYKDSDERRELISYAVDLFNDGNTKRYIECRLIEKGLNPEDAIIFMEMASDIVKAQYQVLNPLDFFIDEKQNRLNVKALAYKIMETRNFVSIGYDGKKDIYVYKDGIFINKGKLIIDKLVNKILSVYVKKEFRREVQEYIEIETHVEREHLNKHKNLINLNNGMFDVQTNELMPHSPEYGSTIRIPVTYDPKAECPNINKFLSEVVSPEDAITLTEYLGYCLVLDVRLQRALMVFGHAGNGKSVFMNLARQIIGKPNVSSIPLQKLAHDKFAVAGLFNMLANICPDIPANKLKTDDVFKQIVGADDDINAEKKFMDQFQFKNYARLMFSANILPEPAGDPNDNEAYYRRWLLVPFRNSFEGKQDTQLLEKLTTETEKSGFLNAMIPALQTILKNGKFTYQKTAAEIEEMYLANMASVDMFLEEKIEVITKDFKDPESYVISKDDLYEMYKRWCLENGAIPKHKDVLCKILINDKEYKYKRVGKKKIGYWKGIAPIGTMDLLRKKLSNDGDEPTIKEEYKPLNPGLGAHFEPDFN